MKILILNGPNLNLLGKRQPEIYGSRSFDDYFKELKKTFPEVAFEHFQSNHEGVLIDKLLGADGKYDYVLLNAGGYTHTSVALADAVAAIQTPVMEVHITDIRSREDFRKNSLLTPHCKGFIAGLGLDSYRMAVEHVLDAIVAGKR